MTLREWLAPVLTCNARQALRIRSQSATIQKQHLVIESLRLDLSEQERRARRWRRTALELGPQVSPRAMDVLLMEVQREELMDLPEVAG